MVPTRRLRAIAAAYAGDRSTVENDVAFLKPKPDGVDTASRIMARLLVTEGSPDAALAEVAKVRRLTHQDGLLRARILEAKLEDARTPSIERNALQDEIRHLRTKHGIITEFEGE